MSYKSDRLAAYLNQTVVWKKKTGQNEYNVPIYTTSNIAARKQNKRTMVRNSANEQVISNTTIYTQSAVNPDDDQIDGELVISVSTWVDRDGTTIGFKVFV